MWILFHFLVMGYSNMIFKCTIAEANLKPKGV